MQQDPNHIHHEPESFADLPIQPTGSGVQDLETAYEQMRLADAADEPADVSAIAPTQTADALEESEAHPS